MKIAIIGHSEKKENKTLKELLEACNYLKHDGVLVDIDDLILEVESGATRVRWVKGDLLAYDIYFIRNVFHAMKKTILVIDWLRWKGKKVLDNNLSIVKYTINKFRTFFELANAGLPVPKTLYCQSKKHFMKCVDEIGYPVIIKSNSSGRGVGVYKCNNEDDVNQLIDMLENKGRDYKKMLIQEYIPYKRDLRVFILGGHAVAAMQRIPKAGEFRANFSLGGSVVKTQLTQEIKSLAEKAAEVTLAEIAGVDLLETYNGEYYILEVNRGAPGITGISKATGENFAVKLINYIVDKYS